MPVGSRMARICICEAYEPDPFGLHAPQISRPVCRLSPAITQRAAMGEPLSAGWTARRVVQVPRSFAQLKKWQQGGRMGAHAVRRGAARAILGAGVSQFLRSGQWRSSAYRLYLDLGGGETSYTWTFPSRPRAQIEELVIKNELSGASRKAETRRLTGLRPSVGDP